MSAIEGEQLIRKSLNIFALLFLLLGSLLGGMITVFYQLQSQNYDDQLCLDEKHSVELQLAEVRNHFNSIVSDLYFLVEHEELQAYLENPSEQNLTPIGREYLAYSVSKKIYDQIRFINETGREIVRVNYNAGAPVIVANDKLQDKSKRYYFYDAYKLSAGEIFISPLDLNVEHGQVETPHKPMVRFGMPVFDRSGKKRGIVLLNYLAQNLLDRLQAVGSVAHGQTMLLNNAGYWLLHPDADKEWGFMFAEKTAVSFARQVPRIWEQLRSEDSGQLRTAEGTYTFATLHPERSVKQSAGSEDYSWKIVSFMSAEDHSSNSKGLVFNLFALGAGLFLVTTVVSWFLATLITRRKLYQAQLFSMAHYDSLTGLPNRTLFFDRLNQTLTLVKRHSRQCALLYVDLDGFKSVNDTLGHAAGDELLLTVSKRLERCSRASDTVARLGGDEFVVLLTEVSGAEVAQFCAEKILQVLQEPIQLQPGETSIGASIGISTFPKHGTSMDALMKSADQAMYLSKQRGKNTITVAGEKI